MPGGRRDLDQVPGQVPALVDPPDPVKNDVLRQYKQVRAHKGHFGRFQRAIFTGIKQFKDQGNACSDTQYEMLVNYVTKLRTQFQQIESIYTDLADLDSRQCR